MTTQSRNKREGWYEGRKTPKILWSEPWDGFSWNQVRRHQRTKSPYSRRHKPKRIFECEIGRLESFRFISSEVINP